MNPLSAWVLPAASLLNDPPAAMKAFCNFRMAWHFIWHALVRQNFMVVSSGDDCAESNMQTGKDDEDLHKALARSPVEN